MQSDQTLCAPKITVPNAFRETASGLFLFIILSVGYNIIRRIFFYCTQSTIMHKVMALMFEPVQSRQPEPMVWWSYEYVMT